MGAWDFTENKVVACRAGLVWAILGEVEVRRGEDWLVLVKNR